MFMETYSIVCMTLGMVALGIVTVVLVQTLLQVKRSARSLEILTDQLNGEVSRWKGVSDTASLWATTMAGTMGKTAIAFLAGIRALMNGVRKKEHPADAESEKSSDRSSN
jgi:hypothetical protein